MLQSTVIQIIEQTAPLSLMAEWDHSGVQVASPRRDISRLAVCLDPLPMQIALALEAGADMVLTHHPLSLSPQWTDRFNDCTDALRMLYSADVPLYACHTTLDANPLGPSAWLPDELGLANRTILEETGTFQSAAGTEIKCGFGITGDLPAAEGFSEFFAKLSLLLPRKNMRSTARLIGIPPEKIRRVAVCTGSGSSLIEEVLASGADVYITGDIKYHDALKIFSRNAKQASDHCDMAILDVGHFSLEEEMMRRFAILLDKRLQGVDVIFLPGRDPFLSMNFISATSEV